MYTLTAIITIHPADEKKVLAVFRAQGYKFNVQRAPQYQLEVSYKVAETEKHLQLLHKNGKQILAIAKNAAESAFVYISDSQGSLVWAENTARKNPPRRKTASFDVISELRSKILLKPDDAVELVRLAEEKEGFLHNKKEHMWTIGLDTRNVVTFMDLVSLGTLNYNLVHPRETFRRAIIEDVASVILVHNHPSETPEFSDEDLSLMKRMAQVGKLVGIEMLDFVVYAGGTFKSAKKGGLL